MTMVKICGLTNLEDARQAARCGADLLGFIFVPSSPRYITPTQAGTIVQTLRIEGYQTWLVGVFADAPTQTVCDTVSRCGLDLVQLHGHEQPPAAARLKTPIVRAVRVRERVDWEALRAWRAWAYLLDAYDPHRLGGTGQSWRWELLREQPSDVGRVIVAGGLTPDNVAEAIRQARPWGVDVSSGVEATPGHKDPAKVARFIRTVREEDER